MSKSVLLSDSYHHIKLPSRQNFPSLQLADITGFPTDVENIRGVLMGGGGALQNLMRTGRLESIL